MVGRRRWGELPVAVCLFATSAQAHFLQTDPIGFKDDVNLYAYVGGDPVNRSDPTGLYQCGGQPCPPEVVQAVLDIGTAASYAPNSEAAGQIGQLATALGANGDDTGVNIIVGGVDRGETADTDARGNVTINVTAGLVAAAGNPELSFRPALAGTIGHGMRHGIDGRSNGGNPPSLAAEMATERNAWRDEIGIYNGLAAAGVPSESVEGIPPAGASQSEVNAAIEAGARSSAAQWCSDPRAPC